MRLHTKTLITLIIVLAASVANSAEPTLDAGRAYGYLVKVCRIGTRVSGTAGMVKQQRLLVDHFRRNGAEVRFQSFDAAHPLTGSPVRMNNLIAAWRPELKQRILLACHYDTRPYPDEDKINKRGVFLGANDGASGVALFMEMAHHLSSIDTPYGIDLVCFDGEELVFGKRGKFFLGSEHFSKTYVESKERPYKFGVLVDMVADRNLRIYMEKNSLKYARELTIGIFKAAQEVGAKEFVSRAKHEIQDDHLPLNRIAKIPTCDLIDFDYGFNNRYWHTTKDVPTNCSGKSLATVGRVLVHWLSTVK